MCKAIGAAAIRAMAPTATPARSPVVAVVRLDGRRGALSATLGDRLAVLRAERLRRLDGDDV